MVSSLGCVPDVSGLSKDSHVMDTARSASPEQEIASLGLLAFDRMAFAGFGIILIFGNAGWGMLDRNCVMGERERGSGGNLRIVVLVPLYTQVRERQEQSSPFLAGPNGFFALHPPHKYLVPLSLAAH